MKVFFFLLSTLSIPLLCNAQIVPVKGDTLGLSIKSVYQLDTSLSFEFIAENFSHNCDSNGVVMRVNSTNNDTINRMFDIVLESYLNGKKLDIHITGCDPTVKNRALVEWVRIRD